MFNTPIFPSWIASEEVRLQLELAAQGKGSIDDECLKVLQQTVQSRCEEWGSV